MRVRSLPFLVVETDSGVVLKRGSTELIVQGESALEAVLLILTTTTAPGQSVDEICDVFAAPDRPAIRSLLADMLQKRLLVPADSLPAAHEIEETQEDIFYWSGNAVREEVVKRLSEPGLIIVGVNRTSLQICRSLFAMGVTKMHLVDDPALRNPELFDIHGEIRTTVIEDGVSLISKEECAVLDPRPRCLLATSDVGGSTILLSWNAWCVQRSIPFFPVYVRDMVGYIGPLVVPGETACLFCLRARYNAHLTDARTRQQIDEALSRGHSIAAIHPSMIQMAAATTVFELCHFFGQLPSPRPGRLITINLPAGSTESKHILKIPRCAVCSTLTRKASVQLRKLTPLPESDEI